MCDGVKIFTQRSAGLPARALYGSEHEHSSLTLRSASDGKLIVPQTKTKAGERAFSVAGPLAWNSLPINC